VRRAEVQRSGGRGVEGSAQLTCRSRSERNLPICSVGTQMTQLLMSVYLAGVLVGLAVMRDRWAVRLLTAALWPLGLAAFAIVMVILLFAAAYLWPIPVIVTLGLAAAAWYAF
jgi:hypothetical protein